MNGEEENAVDLHCAWWTRRRVEVWKQKRQEVDSHCAEIESHGEGLDTYFLVINR